MSLITETLPTAEGVKAAPPAAVTALPAVVMQQVSETVWEQTIADFDGVCQEQLATFAKARWPGASHEPMLFTAGGKTVGGCLVMIQRLPLGLGGIAVSKWGPMLADSQRPDAVAIYAAMIEAMTAHYARERRLMLSVMPHASLEGDNPEFEHLLARGFRRGTTFGFPNRYIVNLRLSDEAQRKSFEQKWRYHLNKSEKARLSFEHAGAERLGEFDALYEAMTDRKKFPDYSAYGTVAALYGIDDPRLRPELFFVRHEGRVVAGAIIFKAGMRAVYLYGATAEAALSLRAGYFMHWHIIRWLRDNTRAGWYDLGGTDGFQGLHQFKKGMVGSGGMIVALPPVANYAAYRLPFLIGEAAFAARELVHVVQRQIDRLRTDRAKPDQKQGGER